MSSVPHPPSSVFRIGFDIGGTKIAAGLLAPDGAMAAKRRVDLPPDYAGFLQAVEHLVRELDDLAGMACPVGVGIGGIVDYKQGMLSVCMTSYLVGAPLAADLSAALNRSVKIVNDADCFAVSEAMDGAGAPYRHVFGAIIGTGAGGAQVFDKKLVTGANGVNGEWGHVPLPHYAPEDGLLEACHCGLRGCVNGFVSGPGLVRLHRHRTGTDLTPPEIAERARQGDVAALATLDHFYDLAAKGFSAILHMIDPDAIIIGGGLYALPGLYEAVKAKLPRYSFLKTIKTEILPAKHDSDSGVRGAAWL